MGVYMYMCVCACANVSNCYIPDLLLCWILCMNVKIENAITKRELRREEDVDEEDVEKKHERQSVLK